MKRNVEEVQKADFCFWPPPQCSSLHNKVAVGMLKFTSELAIPICLDCRQKIDSEHKLVFVPFKEEGSE